MFKIDRNQVQLHEGVAIPLNTVTVGDVPPDQPPPAQITQEDVIANSRAVAEKLLQQAADQAAKVKQDAEALKKQAAAAKQQALEEAATIREKAQAEGYQAGLKEAQADCQKQVEAELQSVRELLAEISRSKDELYSTYEDEIVNLSLDIAKKIVNVAIKKDDTMFESMIVNALRQVKREGQITIRVSHEQYEKFFQSDSATFVLGDESVKTTISDDTILNAGDLIIEADGQTVNAGVDSQFKYITMAFGRAEDLV